MTLKLIFFVIIYIICLSYFLFKCLTYNNLLVGKKGINYFYIIVILLCIGSPLFPYIFLENDNEYYHEKIIITSIVALIITNCNLITGYTNDNSND